MACLGRRAELSLLQPAAHQPEVVDQALSTRPGSTCRGGAPGRSGGAEFRRDRSMRRLLGGLDPDQRRAVQLAMARRLAAVPELFAAAAARLLSPARSLMPPSGARWRLRRANDSHADRGLRAWCTRC